MEHGSEKAWDFTLRRHYSGRADGMGFTQHRRTALVTSLFDDRRNKGSNTSSNHFTLSSSHCISSNIYASLGTIRKVDSRHLQSIP